MMGKKNLLISHKGWPRSLDSIFIINFSMLKHALEIRLYDRKMQ